MIPTIFNLLIGIIFLFLPNGICAADGSLPQLRKGKFTITDEDRSWWSFQPLKEFPNGEQSVDQLIKSELAARKLEMNPPAVPRELVRRAWFDLVGLPPGPDEVTAFEADPSDEAWSKLIDRLLDSPHYGERWGRHWLDLVRYAESNGYERDGPKPNAFRYRDYVIRSFNNDTPYNQFVREQLAGDELAEQINYSESPEQWRQSIIATGFYRLHVWDDEPDSTVAAEYDDFDDILVTSSTAFLGVTLGCARCHDHKFDPFSQADYYSMLSFFRGIDPYGLHKTGGGGRGTGRIERPLASAEEWKRWEDEKKKRVELLEKRVAENAEGEVKKRTLEELERAKQDRGPFAYALAAVENGPKAKATHILARGDPASPRAEVSPAFPAILHGEEVRVPEAAANSSTSGRRQVLADWIASADNPLTARVLANRVWQHHFGRGIVPTADDFGRTGMPPTNPALLDYLASEFIANGWSVKKLHKLIMTSRAYRMSSRATSERGQTTDEANQFLWRQNPRRLEGEIIRDSILAISGALNPKQGGPSVFPKLPPEVHGTQDSAGKGWSDSPVDEQNRRSIYLVVKRALKVPLLECFDFANSTSPTGTRSVTTTAPQALMLLNDSFVHAQAEILRQRLERECGEDREAQIRRAFSLALQRPPGDWEIEQAKRLSLASFCRAILNLNELIYID